MSTPFTISDTGLLLIKAYEGFRETPYRLSNGDYISGYGHVTPDLPEGTITKDSAEDQLREDLKPVEAVVNNSLYAAATQSQFDAMCSLAFAIGEDSFLSSDIIHNLNKGHIIAAANGFDVWRKGRVDGQIYIVDSLVRRRTAEKALFLRPTRHIARAPRRELDIMRDDHLGAGFTDPTPVFREDVDLGVVSDPIIDKVKTPNEPKNEQSSPPFAIDQENLGPSQPLRQDPGASLSLNVVQDAINIQQPVDAASKQVEDPTIEATQAEKLFETIAPPEGTSATAAPLETGESLEKLTIEQPPFPTIVTEKPNEANTNFVTPVATSGPAELDTPKILPPEPPMPTGRSLIEEAAAEVSERLDKLIENSPEESLQQSLDMSSPASLLDARVQAPVQQVPSMPTVDITAQSSAPNALQQDANTAAPELTLSKPQEPVRTAERQQYPIAEDRENSSNFWAFVTMIVAGLVTALIGFGVNMRGAIETWGQNGPLITTITILMGILLFIIGSYYLMKTVFSDDG